MDIPQMKGVLLISKSGLNIEKIQIIEKPKKNSLNFLPESQHYFEDPSELVHREASFKVLEHQNEKKEKPIFKSPRLERPHLRFQVYFFPKLAKNGLKQRARAEARGQEG